jgi:hypothetical protein
MSECVCVCVCVCEREREKERGSTPWYQEFPWTCTVALFCHYHFTLEEALQRAFSSIKRTKGSRFGNPVKLARKGFAELQGSARFQPQQVTEFPAEHMFASCSSGFALMFPGTTFKRVPASLLTSPSSDALTLVCLGSRLPGSWLYWETRAKFLN